MALSGGVDSAVLLALAADCLGARRVLGATAHSSSLSVDDLSAARAVAGHLGVRHVLVNTREMERAGYTQNLGNRCYHCRTELFVTLERIAAEHELPAVAYGAIADDLADTRPGMKAAGERGVLAPLLEAGLTKKEVRAVARGLGLPVADRPAGACLASRIPVGTEVTEERLRQVERAEAGLRALGLVQLRVRHHGELGRVELDGAGLARAAEPLFRQRLIEAVLAAGFRRVAVEAYRTSPQRSGGQ